METDTEVLCAVPFCEGKIIKNEYKTYLGDPKSAIIGPGGKDQMTTVTTLYCSVCGILYHHLPKG